MLHVRGLIGHRSEQPNLSALLVLPCALSALHGGLDHRGQLRAVAAQARQSSRLHEILENALVHASQVDAFAQIVQRLERSAALTSFDDRIGAGRADISDGAQPHTNALAIGRKIATARIYVRRQHRNAHFAAFVDVFHHFVGVAHFRRQ